MSGVADEVGKHGKCRSTFTCHYLDVMTRVEAAPPSWFVDVLNPSWRIADNRSAFDTGFANDAANKLLAALPSVPQ